MFCPLCKSTSCKVLDERFNYILLSCNECGLVFKHIKDLQREVVQRLQDSVYTQDNLAGRVKNRMVRKMACDRLQYLSRYCTSGNLLEIGCATGEFLVAAEEFGFHATGLESSKIFFGYLTKIGIRAKYGRIEDVDFDKNNFDVIAISHVIEHIEDPHRFISELNNLLKPGGILFIVTPNLNSFTDKLYGWSHPNFLEADHLFFYSESTLSLLLKRYGFHVLAVSSKEYPHHFFSSFKGFIGNKLGSPLWMKILFKVLPPSRMGQIMFPFMKAYGYVIDRTLKGHELFMILQKNDKRSNH